MLATYSMRNKYDASSITNEDRRQNSRKINLFFFSIVVGEANDPNILSSIYVCCVSMYGLSRMPVEY